MSFISHHSFPAVVLSVNINLVLDSRSQSYVGITLSPYKVGSLNSKLFLSEISKREKTLCKMLEGMYEKLHIFKC